MNIGELKHLLSHFKDDLPIRLYNGKGKASNYFDGQLEQVDTITDFIQYDKDVSNNIEIAFVLYPGKSREEIGVK